MPRALAKSPKPTQSSGAVNVVCIDVNTLLRAAREKEKRERYLLDDRPVLGKSADELLEEEMQANRNRPSPPPDGAEDEATEEPAPAEEAAEPAASHEASASTTTAQPTDYLIKGCARDAMVFPPLSPADATILQAVLRNPELTLAGGEHVVSRPSWTARQTPFSQTGASSIGGGAAGDRAERSGSPASSTSTSASAAVSAAAVPSSVHEAFRVVPHTEPRFRAHRRSHVDLEPYTHPTGSASASFAHPRVSGDSVRRTSMTQMFSDDGRRRSSRTTIAAASPLRPEPTTAFVSPIERTHEVHRRSTQPMGPPQARGLRASATGATDASVSSSTVDCLVFEDAVDVPRGAAWPAHGTDALAQTTAEAGTDSCAALTRRYLRGGAGAGSQLPGKSSSTTTTTMIGSRKTTDRTGQGSPWEPLPSVKPRPPHTAFQSTLRSAHAVEVEEQAWRQAELRRRQMESKPTRPSLSHAPAATSTTKRHIPIAFRQAVDLADNQPPSRRPKRK